MAHDSDLPCDGDGRCMICKITPPVEETLTCKTCVTPWHLNCLSARPQTLADAAQWECPDCSNLVSSNPIPATGTSGSEPADSLIAAIRAIESDASLSDQEKAKRRQQLMSGGGSGEDDKKEIAGGGNDVLKLLSGSFNCSFCMQLPERPVTTPCGHNFCLKCFEKWVGQGKRTCAICRTSIPPKMASQPRINSSLVIAIRMAKMTRSNAASGPPKAYFSVLNQNRPDKAYTTERAKKPGKANACSGKIFVTVPPDHFGPILADNDPDRGMGVLVGETWEDRMECRQWGAHLPHVAGICGQSDYGAQSVALSGGYEDDEDHGEWFLYTGSGGRDLSGNKRTNKTQSFDQKFDKSNEALRVSCKKGYPVRVVRSHKEKRSAYAPEKGVRYDGIYRIEKCWRKPGIQGYKVCRYLFVRCDNDPAPWTSDDNGDRPRPLPVIKELKDATDVTDRKSSPSWDYDEEKACWSWKIPPPGSRKHADSRDIEVGATTKKVRRKTQMMSVSERLLKEFCCLICHKVMNLPLTTPCAHNFCKSCLQDTFAGQTFIKERTCEGRRTLRAQKNIMKCPSCTNDISEYLQNPQVNRELMSVIESLQRQTKEAEENAASEEEMEETAALGEEMLKTDEKKDDVIEEDKVRKPEAATEVVAEEKDSSPEADGKVEKPEPELQDEIMEAVSVDKAVSDEAVDKNEAIAEPSPKGKPIKNKKRKVGVEVQDEIMEAVSEDKVVSDENVDKREAIAEPSRKAKTIKNKKQKVGVEVQDEIVEAVSEDKVVSDENVDKTEALAKPSRKAKPIKNKKRKAGVEVQDEIMEAVSEDKVVSDEAVDKSEAMAEPSPKGKHTKNKKRKAGVADNTPNKKLHEETAILMNEDASPAGNDIKAASLKAEPSESKDKKVGEVGKEGKKKTSKTKKDNDAKGSSPTGAGARTRSKKT